MNLFELSATMYGGQSLRRRRRASDDRPVTGFPTGNHPVLPSPSFFFFSLSKCFFFQIFRLFIAYQNGTILVPKLRLKNDVVLLGPTRFDPNPLQDPRVFNLMGYLCNRSFRIFVF